MFLAYTAGPYRSHKGTYHVEQNIRRAEGVAVRLWQMGWAVLCPHLNTKHLDGAISSAEPEDPLGFPDCQLWLTGDLEMLRRCDCVVLLPGWQGSEGARAEKECAEELSIPLFRWGHPPDMDVLQLIGKDTPPDWFKKRM